MARNNNSESSRAQWGAWFEGNSFAHELFCHTNFNSQLKSLTAVWVIIPNDSILSHSEGFRWLACLLSTTFYAPNRLQRQLSNIDFASSRFKLPVSRSTDNVKDWFLSWAKILETVSSLSRSLKPFLFFSIFSFKHLAPFQQAAAIWHAAQNGLFAADWLDYFEAKKRCDESTYALQRRTNDQILKLGFGLNVKRL